MNLTIDIGNSRIKAAVFDDNNLINTYVLDQEQSVDIKSIIGEWGAINKSIISSVTELQSPFIRVLQKDIPYIIYLDLNTPIPVKNSYKSKTTLGMDRIADVVGAYSMYPGENILIIDAGTAVTFDVLTSKGEYIGGNISPGLNMRYKALYTFTGQLPLLQAEKDPPFIGDDTINAIHAGVQNGLIMEMLAYIDKLSGNYENLRIILTGGDANFFDRKLKKPIFVFSNLLSIGLNFILKYNDKKK
ncbi:MAG: type III pantothenate kinase [Bacteroidales bacterium]|nr:type III pantothenate kinase [Bacteroidales bacterium]